jgi:uncharacterized membrane protein YidH (DUF202 family)
MHRYAWHSDSGFKLTPHGVTVRRRLPRSSQRIPYNGQHASKGSNRFRENSVSLTATRHFFFEVRFRSRIGFIITTTGVIDHMFLHPHVERDHAHNVADFSRQNQHTSNTPVGSMLTIVGFILHMFCHQYFQFPNRRVRRKRARAQHIPANGICRI